MSNKINNSNSKPIPNLIPNPNPKSTPKIIHIFYLKIKYIFVVQQPFSTFFLAKKGTKRK